MTHVPRTNDNITDLWNEMVTLLETKIKRLKQSGLSAIMSTTESFFIINVGPPKESIFF
jgi:hypothetical protein